MLIPQDREISMAYASYEGKVNIGIWSITSVIYPEEAMISFSSSLVCIIYYIPQAFLVFETLVMSYYWNMSEFQWMYDSYLSSIFQLILMKMWPSVSSYVSLSVEKDERYLDQRRGYGEFLEPNPTSGLTNSLWKIHAQHVLQLIVRIL